MKLLRLKNNKQVSKDNKDSCDGASAYQTVKFSLLEGFREGSNDDKQARQAKLELTELQRMLGSKSRKDAMAAMNEFVDMMENGSDGDELGHF